MIYRPHFPASSASEGHSIKALCVSQQDPGDQVQLCADLAQNGNHSLVQSKYQSTISPWAVPVPISTVLLLHVPLPNMALFLFRNVLLLTSLVAPLIQAQNLTTDNLQYVDQLIGTSNGGKHNFARRWLGHSSDKTQETCLLVLLYHMVGHS